MMLKIKNSNLESENEVLKQKIKELEENGNKKRKDNGESKKDSQKIKELMSKIEMLKKTNKKENNEWQSIIDQLKGENEDLKSEVSIKKEMFA